MRDYKYGDLYFDTQHDKQMKIDVVGTGIVIDNSMIEMEAFELDETLCSETELKFGRCEANCVKFTARNLPGSIIGKTINITETIDGNTDEPFQYGKYKVYSDVPTSDRTKREITAYDAMYDIINADVKQWYAGLSFPMTLRQFRDSFFVYLGITQKETTLVNDGMTVNKALITESSSNSNVTEVDCISGKTVIEAICEINGVFGNINQGGLFEYVELKPIITPLYPANDLYPRDDLFPRDPNTVSMSGHYITFDYEDFQTKEITQLEIRPSDYTAGEKVGEPGNNYVISGNFLVSDKSGAELNGIAQNVFEVIKKVSYTPIKSSSCVGNPCIELGDPIRFNTTREIVESYVLQRTLTGIQAKRDSIESRGVEYYPINKNSLKNRVESVENRTESLEQTADEIQEDVGEFKNDTTVRFEKTENSIEAEVTRAQGAESGLSSRLSITESDISTEVSNRQSADSEMSTRISQTAQEISSEVTARQSADSEMSARISQAAHRISLSASGGDNSASITIQLYDENGNLIDTSSGNANINIVGFVSFSDLSGDGTTTINGKNIKTGRIESVEFYSEGYDVGYLTKMTLSDGIAIFEGAEDGTSKLTVSRAALRISKVNSSYRDFWINYKGISCYSAEFDAANIGRLYIGSYRAATVNDLSGYAKSSDIPSSTYLDNRYMHSKVSGESDGTGSVFVHGVYYSSGTLTVTTASVSSSDERLKTNISDMPDMESVYLKFKPKKFRFDDRLKGYDHRWHYGLLAQSVESDLINAGIFIDDTGLIWKEPVYDDFHEREVIGDESVYKLDKDELHAMHIQMIQKQHYEIEQLKQENLALQNRLSILEQRMEVLENVINNKNN